MVGVKRIFAIENEVCKVTLLHKNNQMYSYRSMIVNISVYICYF